MPHLTCFISRLAFAAAFALAAQSTALAAPATKFAGNKPVAMEVTAPPADAPVTLEADRMGYDQEQQVVIAEGNVQVVQGDYILRADQITFYQQQDFMRADGNVSVLQPSGDIYFADNVELTGDMKSGIVLDFRARLSDNSVFAANEAERVNPAVTKMTKAVYSPCKLCEGKDPFWQMKASEVTVDNINETVEYKNARIEFGGIPAFYTPYFSHPTPDAGAKNGILLPEYSQSSLYGTTVRVPYYWRIAPDKEAVITPWYMSEDGVMLQSTYRQLTDRGSFEVQTSGMLPEERAGVDEEFRGHIFASGVQNRSDYSRWGFNINRASDDTYLRRYGFSNEFSLTSRLYAETAVGRNYALAESMVFQALRQADDSSLTPRILPSLSGYYETEPMTNGARLYGAANLQNLARPTGAEYQRASFTGGAKLPYVSTGGHVFEAELSVRTDAYSLNDVTLAAGGTFEGEQYRALPQAALTWRYPLITRINDASLTVEPIVVGVAQPRGGNPEEIPNIDNRIVELTDTNIFSTQRMPGYDTVDSGSRVAYGIRSQMLFPEGQAIDAMLAQSYNAEDTPFPNARVLGEELSDYIGRVGLRYDPISISYRFALDQGSFEPNRSEVWASYLHKRFQLTGAYLSVEDSPYVRDSQEALGSATLELSDEWSVFGSARRDLNFDAMVLASGGLIYTNECFSLLTQMERTYTRDRDIEPSTAISLRLGFKNLGEFGND